MNGSPITKEVCRPNQKGNNDEYFEQPFHYIYSAPHPKLLGSIPTLQILQRRSGEVTNVWLL